MFILPTPALILTLQIKWLSAYCIKGVIHSDKLWESYHLSLLQVSALVHSVRSFSEMLVKAQTRAKKKAVNAFQINATSVQYLLDV